MKNNSLFSRLSLNQKLLGSFGLMAGLLATVGYIGYDGLNRQEEKIHVYSDTITPSLVELGKMQRGGRDVAYVLAQLTFSTNDQSELDRLAQRYEEAIATIETSFDVVQHLSQIEGEAAVAPPLAAAIAKLKTETREMLQNSKQVNPKTGLTDPAAADYLEKAFATSFRPVRDAYTQAIADYLELFTSTARAEAVLSQKVSDELDRWNLAAVLTGIVFALATGLLLARSLNRQLSHVSRLLQAESGQLRETSDKLAEASTSLSSSIDEQASALQETASAVDEVNSMVKKNAENAQFSKKVANETSQQTDEGKRVVGEVIGAMGQITSANNDIEQQVHRSNQELSDLVKVIAEIGAKTKVIHDIVFQTKLLSFNASVEAARAGEHGKGFAVVAEEVGNLAQMSGKAAKEISEILDGSLRKVEQVVSETKSKVGGLVESSKGRIERGVAIAQQCDKVFGNLSGNVRQVDNAVEEISTASNEQSQGVNEISKAIAQLESVTQQNAQAARDAESSAARVRDNSSRLEEVVASLLHTVHGSGYVAHATVIAPTSASTGRTNVVALTTFKETRAAAAPSDPRASSLARTPAQKVVGAENVPSADDTRFEDV